MFKLILAIICDAHRALESSSFCDFSKMNFCDFTAVFAFQTQANLYFFNLYLTRSIIYPSPNMIDFDVVDFSMHHSEEIMFLLTLNVFFI